MLFDLKGKRRRAVQGTYLTLAILMGAGLVLFGIGSDVQGGLGDLFTGGGGSNKGDEIVQKRINTAEKQLAKNPRDQAALAQVIRGHYQLASSKIDQSGRFRKGAEGELTEATEAWQKYLALKPKKPDLSLAGVMVQAYRSLGENEADQQDARPHWEGASQAIEIIAERQPTVNNYINLVQYATYAGQTDKARLAGKKAVELAPKKQRKAVQEQVKAASTPPQAAGAAGAG